MKRSIVSALAVALALLPATGVSSSPNPIPQRVLSLDLCSDRMLARYADPSQVAALSPLLKQYPVEWAGEAWPAHNGSLEQVMQLKPDLVISGEYNALLLRQRLKSFGVRVEVLALPRTLPEVIEYEKRFLSLIGLPESAASRPVANSTSSKPARLLLLGANGIGTGRQTFEHGLIEHAGWTNYLSGNGYIDLDLEQLVTDPPDAVMWWVPKSAALANQFAEHPALRRAIPHDRWLDSSHWLWQCPGPWTWQLIEQLQEQRKQWPG